MADDPKQYIRPLPRVSDSRIAYVLWALANPLFSLQGGRALRSYVDDAVPDVWSSELKGKRVLVVGSGPSVDRVGSDFFDRFDTAIYINFALLARRPSLSSYFFTTDIGVAGDFIRQHGVLPFRELGRARAVLAPVFLDQWRYLTPEGRGLFTMLRFDAARWVTQPVHAFPGVRLPFVLRYHPVQPDWDRFTLPPGGRTLPVLNHTSALTATLFAAIHGARDIGLIGCDFSAGRSRAVVKSQGAAAPSAFSGAAAEFNRMVTALERQGVHAVNHSWLV